MVGGFKFGQTRPPSSFGSASALSEIESLLEAFLTSIQVQLQGSPAPLVHRRKSNPRDYASNRKHLPLP